MDSATATATPSTDTSKQIGVTNNSDDIVCVLCPTTNDPNVPADGVMVYDQALELLQATDNSTTIQAGEAKTFTLDQYYVDPVTNKETYATIYNLLVSSSASLFPVANLGVMQLMSQFPKQTVTTAMAKSMRDAATFFQTISAYPNSKLATSFQDAMSDTQTAAGNAADGSAGSSNAIVDTIADGVNAFFQSTTSYQDVTLESFVAVQSYYQAFPFAFAAFSSKTFYLYGNNGSAATMFMGTLALTQPATPDVTKPSAGYACVFTPATTPTDTTTVAVDPTKAKNLIYLDGLFIDQNNPDDPSIAVKGLFMVKSQFTQSPSDTNIIPVLSGTVESITALGFDEPQLSNDQQDSAFWKSLFAPKGPAQIFQCVMTWGGAVMLLAFIGGGLYGIFKWYRTRNEPTMKEMFDQQLKSFQDALKAQNQQSSQKMSDGKMDAPPDPQTAMKDLATQTENIADQVNAASLQDGIDASVGSLQELATYESSMTKEQLTQLEVLGQKVNDMQTALDVSTPDTLGAVVQQQSAAMKELHGQMDDFVESVSTSISTSSKAQIKSNQAAVEKANEQIEESQKEQENMPEEDNPKSEPIEEV
ncbi:hypothetical protein [Xanthomonas euvesicatoria]|uniref:hypothetical protein n=1 Tax=Xanthomonas euvesicatoria TaxID=456327 RepID=UPI001C48D434|nr:hypothetical protein [Xanthomonas euvesicatoria]MBV6829926.1 hypothetical protein [Xanthomonas campestris pv. viegasii]